MTSATAPVYTTVRLTKTTWRRLNARKEVPNETVDDVVVRLLDLTERESVAKPPG